MAGILPARFADGRSQRRLQRGQPANPHALPGSKLCIPCRGIEKSAIQIHRAGTRGTTKNTNPRLLPTTRPSKLLDTVQRERNPPMAEPNTNPKISAIHTRHNHGRRIAANAKNPRHSHGLMNVAPSRGAKGIQRVQIVEPLRCPTK